MPNLLRNRLKASDIREARDPNSLDGQAGEHTEDRRSQGLVYHQAVEMSVLERSLAASSQGSTFGDRGTPKISCESDST